MAEFSSANYETIAADAKALLLRDIVSQRMAKTIAVTSPAVGSDVTVTVPAGCVWEPLAMVATITASAVVANRLVALTFSDGNAIFGRIGAFVTLVASDVGRFSWLRDFGVTHTTAKNVGLTTSLPMLSLPSGYQIATATTGIDVGDTWTAVTLLVREWSEWGAEWFTDSAAEYMRHVAE